MYDHNWIQVNVDIEETKFKIKNSKVHTTTSGISNSATFEDIDTTVLLASDIDTTSLRNHVNFKIRDVESIIDFYDNVQSQALSFKIVLGSLPQIGEIMVLSWMPLTHTQPTSWRLPSTQNYTSQVSLVINIPRSLSLWIPPPMVHFSKFSSFKHIILHLFNPSQHNISQSIQNIATHMHTPRPLLHSPRITNSKKIYTHQPSQTP